MKLRFYAKGTDLVSLPGERRLVGAHPRYVGRKADGKGGFPARSEAHEADADSEAGRRLAKLCSRDGSLWPADEETARECRVPFVPVAFSDGAWLPCSTEAAPAQRSFSGSKARSSTKDD